VSPPNPRTAILAGALLAAAWVGAQLQVPLMEDSLFWWVPKGLLAAQEGLSVSMSGPLPEIMRTGSQASASF
jgi:hypothetical protein